MNIIELDVLNNLATEEYFNQRMVSEDTGYSIGSVNGAIKHLVEDNYLDDDFKPTDKALELMKECAPKNAIILAAGTGMRSIPINTQISKAMVEVNGEPLIERVIKQLREVNIQDIYVVVGFMKEQFEYLIDLYNVKLIVNPNYSKKNNLSSLALASEYISNSYIVPCDLWCSKNPFRKQELYSWYMLSDRLDRGSKFKVNRKKEILRSTSSEFGNKRVGIAYLQDACARIVRNKLENLNEDNSNAKKSWEEALYMNNKMIVLARVIKDGIITEIDTYEQLRELDEESKNLKSYAIDLAAKTFDVSKEDICNIEVLKKGMTNKSFLFEAKRKKYIMRIPGEGTEKLINRRNEAAVYSAIVDKDLCDDIIYIDPEKGYKITTFIEGARTCDPKNMEEVVLCIQKLKKLHNLEIKVDNNRFDLFGQIDFYESLWEGRKSSYRDYDETKKNVFSLREYIDNHVEKEVLTHIDAVPDNFVITPENQVKLIDWEYAGMQDPHLDIAMFCIYSMYEREEIDKFIDIYFENKCPIETRLKIYCYIAAGGLLWSNWCEYKSSLGVEFGEYSLMQYRYAKKYYRIFKSEVKKYNEQS